MPHGIGPGWQLKKVIGDAIDQRGRRKPTRARRMGATSGGRIPYTPPTGGENITGRTVLAVADGASVTLDIGATAELYGVRIGYWARRNFATPEEEWGQLVVAHLAGVARDPQRTAELPGEINLEFSAAVVGGVLQLTVTASDETPDATADVILVITPIEVL